MTTQEYITKYKFEGRRLNMNLNDLAVDMTMDFISQIELYAFKDWSYNDFNKLVIVPFKLKWDLLADTFLESFWYKFYDMIQTDIVGARFYEYQENYSFEYFYPVFSKNLDKGYSTPDDDFEKFSLNPESSTMNKIKKASIKMLAQIDKNTEPAEFASIIESKYKCLYYLNVAQ
jgi:hypothetical protein